LFGKSIPSRIRNGALAVAFVSAALYPRLFVDSFYKPKEVFEGLFVLFQKQADKKESQPLITSPSTTSEDNQVKTMSTEQLSEQAPKETTVNADLTSENKA